MALSSIQLLPLFFLYFLCFFPPSTKSNDLQLLLTLKKSLQTTTSIFNSWNPNTSICSFTGITCGVDNSVLEIDLSKQNLSGVLPIDSICQLQSLEKLSLGFNSIYGTVSEDLNKCVKLKYLNLGNNLFTGNFPDISSLSQLEHLYVNHSGFTGVFPWDSLANMSNLITLSVGDNPFDRSPFPSKIMGLTKLNWLYLSNCSVEGTIPEWIGNLSELTNFEVSSNYMSGSIPPGIGNLKNLWQLELYNNNFTGDFPFGFRNLTKLENFDASDNYLSGNLSELRFLTNLVSLQLYENELSGEIPVEFGGFQKLVNLSLYRNQLTGSLPPLLGSWADFDSFDVSENYLFGTIPPDMCKKGTMRFLLILQNNLTGQIPESYANCSTLERFRISKNLLSGEVPPGIWGLPRADIIDIEFNQLEGSLTSDIRNAKSLTHLFLKSNRLSGQLPEEISEATNLVSLELNDNRFSGKIPETIGELKQLNVIHFQNNMFSGSIPGSLGSCDSLSDLNLAHNSLSGEIPSSLGALPTLNYLNLSGNELSGQIPNSLSSLLLSLIDLSNNRLTGPIPQSLSIEANNGSFLGNPGLCSPSIPSFPRCSPVSGRSKDVTIIVGLIAGSILLLVSLAWLVYLKKSEKDRKRSLKEESWDVTSFHVMSFTEDEIIDSIKEENLIGKGGSGNVYKVQLSNGLDLAVKHIWNTDSTTRKGTWRSTTPMLGKKGEKSKEFDAEVQTLSSIRHVNVVKLYCSITSEDSSLLVYEYLPNGSLWDRLHTSQKMELDWETRYEIAVGAAKGLEYLHHGCDRPVIHRDVKSSNILLDEFLKPRIADFGLAKIVQANSAKDTTHVIAGTLGYIAPEYGYTCKVNEKSDVYSFGVVLMELVSGKRPIEPEYGENKDIVDWISSKLKSKESVLSIVDSRIPEAFKEDAIKVLRIAILCTSRLPNLRPTMRSVIQMLEEAEPCKLVGLIISKDGGHKLKEQVKVSDKLDLGTGVSQL